MGIGVGIFLVACGAILTFAVHASVSGLDLRVVGVILMVAGIVGIALELIMFAPRRRRAVTTGVAPAQQTTVTKRDVY